MTLPSKLHWRRVPQILAGTWPQPLPPLLQVGQANFNEIAAWFQEAHAHAPYIAWDTEFIYHEKEPRHPDNHTLTMVSIGYPGMKAGVLLQYIGGQAEKWEKAEFIKRFWNLAMDKPNVFHNVTAEMQSTQKTWGWNPAKFWGRFDDSMLAHAVLWSEFAHTLEFLESIYGQRPKIKHLPTSDPTRNWGDTVLTIDAWEQLKGELDRDPESLNVYRTQSLNVVPIIYRRERQGLLVNQARVGPALVLYRAKMEAAERLAQAYVGWPINMNSPAQLGHWLYDVEGLGQVKSKKTKKRTCNGDAVALMRGKVLPFDADYETQHSVTEAYVDTRIESGAHPLLEAKVLHGEAEQILSHYLEPLIIGA